MNRTSPPPNPLRDVVEPEWTPRQRQVLDLLAKGRTNPEIAEALGISRDGAKWHVSEVLSKLGVESREEAAEYWRARNGLRLRFTRMLRALVPGAAWLKVAGAVAGVAALSAVVFVVVDLRAASGTGPQPRAGRPTLVATPTTLATPTEAVGTTSTATVNLPAWSQQLPPVVQQVATAVEAGDRAAILGLLHFRSPFGKSYIGFMTACEGGGGLTSPDDVVDHLLEISTRHGVLSEAARANEEVQTPNLVYFLIFRLADPGENRAVVADDQGVIMLVQGCDPTADNFAGNGNATVWR